jgi:uncharacterized protein (UPF0332 family)
MVASQEDWDAIATESFRTVSLLLRREHHRSTVSRAYFAAYAKLVAALIHNKVTMPARGNPSHSKMPALVLNHLTRLSQVRRNNLCGVLITLYRLRVAADYQPLVNVGPEDVRIGTGLMGQVFRDAKEAML